MAAIKSVAVGLDSSEESRHCEYVNLLSISCSYNIFASICVFIGVYLQAYEINNFPQSHSKPTFSSKFNISAKMSKLLPSAIYGGIKCYLYIFLVNVGVIKTCHPHIC